MPAPVEIVNQAASDWPVIIAAVATGLASVGGYWFAGKNDEKRDNRALGREVEVRRLERQQRLEDSAHDFQRELMLQLQDEMQRLSRVTFRILIHDDDTMRQHGTFTLVGEELDTESLSAGISVRRLLERLTDDQLREEIKRFHAQMSSAGTAQASGMEQQDALNSIARQRQECLTSYLTASDALGKALRHELGRR